MKYLFLIYVDEAKMEPGSHPSEIDAHIAFAREAVAGGNYVGGSALTAANTATTVRVRDGRALITDGPFAETREVLAGFYALDCADLDDALAAAQRIPPATHGAIEIRAVVDIPGWDEAIGLTPVSR